VAGGCASSENGWSCRPQSDSHRSYIRAVQRSAKPVSAGPGCVFRVSGAPTLRYVMRGSHQRADQVSNRASHFSVLSKKILPWYIALFRASPAVLSMRPCKNISHIQVLVTFFPTPAIKLKLGLQIANRENTNSDPTGPIGLSSQSETGSSQ